MGVLGRLPPIDPIHSEKFHQRILLQNVKGAISFDDLRTDPDTKNICTSYKEACLLRSLIKNDSE